MSVTPVLNRIAPKAYRTLPTIGRLEKPSGHNFNNKPFYFGSSWVSDQPKPPVLSLSGSLLVLMASLLPVAVADLMASKKILGQGLPPNGRMTVVSVDDRRQKD